MDGDAVINVVDVVALAAVENLDVFCRMHRVRERLRAAVVGDGNCLVPPAFGALDDVAVGPCLRENGRERVHGGHVGVQMQLHTLFRRRVGPDRRGDFDNRIRLHDHFVVVPVEGHFALNFDPHAGGNTG